MFCSYSTLLELNTVLPAHSCYRPLFTWKNLYVLSCLLDPYLTAGWVCMLVVPLWFDLRLGCCSLIVVVIVQNRRGLAVAKTAFFNGTCRQPTASCCRSEALPNQPGPGQGHFSVQLCFVSKCDFDPSQVPLESPLALHWRSCVICQ